MESNLINAILENNILLVQKQIAKDFSPYCSDFPKDFETEIYSIESILSQVKLKLVEIMEVSEQKTLQLLYTIDVAEARFLETTIKKDVLSNLADEILKREAQKIYYRIKFSQ